MITFFFVLVGLSLLILGHEAGHFFVAKLAGLRVNEFGFGFPPRIFAWRPKRWVKEGGTRRQIQSETEYSFNWLPFGGFVKIAGENDVVDHAGKLEHASGAERKKLFTFQSATVRSLVVLAGVSINFLIGWGLLTLVLLVGAPKLVVITDIEPGSPAAEAGFLKGDVVRGFTDSEELIKFVQEHKGQPLTLTVVRGAGDKAITAVPRAEPEPGQGALGVALKNAGEERRSLSAAIATGFDRAIKLCVLIVQVFGALIYDLFFHGRLLEGVVGPVGIFGAAQEASQVGFIYLIQLLAIISLNLTVVNLMPFPALDGGRFFMILIEKIKGSPIPFRIEAALNAVGFLFLIVLILLLTLRDVGSLL